MSRILFVAIVITFCELFLGATAASACGRCGIFGRGCRFHAAPVVHHAAPVIKQQDQIQNFIFNNVAPVGDLSPRGDTVFGLARALNYNSPDSSLYLDIARRSLEVASEMGGNARTLDSEVLEAATIDARGRAVEAAFRALKPDVTARSTSTTTRITLKNGLPVFEDTQDVQPIARDFRGLTCRKCHSPGGDGSKKFLIDGTISLDQYAQAKASINAGRMPPDSNLSPAEKLSLEVQIGKLVEQ